MNRAPSSKQDFLLSEKRGFTLIELLVVISIIALLSSIVLSSLNAARLKADESKVLSQYNQLRISLELYQSDNGGYPAPATSPVRIYCVGICKHAGLTTLPPLNTGLALAGKPAFNYIPDTKILPGDYGFVYRVDVLGNPDRVIFASPKSGQLSAKIGVWTLSTGSN